MSEFIAHLFCAMIPYISYHCNWKKLYAQDLWAKFFNEDFSYQLSHNEYDTNLASY